MTSKCGKNKNVAHEAQPIQNLQNVQATGVSKRRLNAKLVTILLHKRGIYKYMKDPTQREAITPVQNLSSGFQQKGNLEGNGKMLH